MTYKMNGYQPAERYKSIVKNLHPHFCIGAKGGGGGLDLFYVLVSMIYGGHIV
jgi:hypothetical protein